MVNDAVNLKPPGPMKAFWFAFRENKGAVVGATIVLLVVFCAVFCLRPVIRLCREVGDVDPGK